MKLEKLTPVNGFDKRNPDNARQNNYAWSMVEFNGYVYVGTGRNIVYRGCLALGVEPPKSFTPKYPSTAAEVWRYPLYQCQNQKWERVYKAEEEFGATLFRDMVVFRTDEGVKMLCGGCFGLDGKKYVLTSRDGVTWNRTEIDMPPEFYVRPMQVHKDKLYVAACQPLEVLETTYLYVSTDPEKDWTRVNTDMITGEIFSMTSFNGYLYIGTMPPGGFAVWKSRCPESGQWELVVDKGAGDALNEIPMDMEAFDGYLYITSGINGAIYSTNPENRFVLPKGFDLIRVSKDNIWEVIVGQEPISPTKPLTGKRNVGIYPSGFSNMFNPYGWTLRNYNGKLYVGTWDSAIFYKIFLHDLGRDFSAETVFDLIELYMESEKDISEENYNVFRWMRAYLTSFINYPRSFGADIFSTEDGLHFESENLNGFGNPENYGIRNMLETSDGRLFIGTANPTQGCEVWATKPVYVYSGKEHDFKHKYESNYEDDDDDFRHEDRKHKNEE